VYSNDEAGSGLVDFPPAVVCGAGQEAAVITAGGLKTFEETPG
jgi:hypothetical protein